MTCKRLILMRKTHGRSSWKSAFHSMKLENGCRELGNRLQNHTGLQKKKKKTHTRSDPTWKWLENRPRGGEGEDCLRRGTGRVRLAEPKRLVVHAVDEGLENNCEGDSEGDNQDGLWSAVGERDEGKRRGDVKSGPPVSGG